MFCFLFFIQQSKKIYSQYQKYGDLPKEQYKHYTEYQRTLQIYKGILSLISKKDKQALSDLFGYNWRYFPLLIECFTSDLFGKMKIELNKQIGEQEMKRGTTNYYNKYYSIEFCPFRSIIQLSNKTDTWQKRNNQYIE